MYLKNIADDRINLIEALVYIETKSCISFGNIKDLLPSIAQKYEKLRAYIIKCAFTNRNTDMYKISSEMDEIYDLEKNVLSCFKNICGGELYAEYSLRLPMNNLDYDHIPIPINRDSEDIIRRSKVEIDRICICIMKRNKTRYKVLKRVFFHMMKPIYKLIQTVVIKELKVKAHKPKDSELLYYELIPLTDKSIIVDEKCTSCGICAKICPVDNIKIVNQKPEFQHRCEMCFACDEWCPTKSIRHWSRKNGVKYHHPEVSIKDMLNK